MAKEMADDEKLAANSGLDSDEIAFYRALIQNESAVRELGDNNLRELAKHVTTPLRKSTTVDCRVRDSVRAKLRNLVRWALRKWKYPPDKVGEAIELCLKQAEALSEHSSASLQQAWCTFGGSTFRVMKMDAFRFEMPLCQITNATLLELPSTSFQLYQFKGAYKAAFGLNYPLFGYLKYPKHEKYKPFD